MSRLTLDANSLLHCWLLPLIRTLVRENAKLEIPFKDDIRNDINNDNEDENGKSASEIQRTMGMNLELNVVLYNASRISKQTTFVGVQLHTVFLP